MREIKFRAWIIKDNRMEHSIDFNPFYVGDCDRLHWKHEEVELMQYTGLKDKNGKEIYEGDVAIVAKNHGKQVITFKHGMFKFGSMSLCTFTNVGTDYWCEVVGNIYETPELAVMDS